MKSVSFLCVCLLPVPCLVDAAAIEGRHFDFPIYTNQPSGRQVGGQHAPATTDPLTPEEARKRFEVPEGFEVRLFATEPEVVNPVAMSWDARGRLWVLELYEYPMGAEEGRQPRDRIKILEDTDADGRADKVHVWADGLNLATGLLLGDGGVYVGQAPHLLHLKDTTGDDRADTREVVMTGFGLEDRHELLNGFNWGPDGHLYMTHGVFTYSTVRDPDDPDDDGVAMNAALARWHPRTKRFEVFADGTSNPWGVDFDRHGNAFVSACVIDHLFHMAPGGIYARQAGTPAFPYAYELLPSIVDHRHHMAAYCGVQVYLGDQYPAAHQDTILMGNIHDNAVHQDRLTPDGSSFKASFERDFLRTEDGWFRPVVQQVGPDGAVWIADWYDRYPCYQNARADPEGVDREFGRVWRVVYTGGQPDKPVPSRPDPAMDLAKLEDSELVSLLEHPNIWHRKQAQRLLTERSGAPVRAELEDLLKSAGSLDGRLFALWTLHACGLLDEATLDRHASDAEAPVRAWVARLTGERRALTAASGARLERLATDNDPGVRLAVTTALRQYVSGSLTVNTPLPPEYDGLPVGQLLGIVVMASRSGEDPVLPFLVWMAAEPLVMRNTAESLDWLAENGADGMPLTGTLMRKVMRRLCDTGEGARIDLAMDFIERTAGTSPAFAAAALEGLIEGQKGRAVLPATDPEAMVGRWIEHPDAGISGLARQLGTLWGNEAAVKSSFALVLDAAAPASERRNAIRAIREQKNEAARDTLLQLVAREPDSGLAIDAIQTLGEIGGDAVAPALIEPWKRFTPRARQEAAAVLVSRPRWASSFLSAIEQEKIAAGDVPATAVRALVRSDADYGMLAKRASQVFGRVRDADADKLKLIAEKRKVVLSGEPDLEAGREVARQACLVCHKLHDDGGEVGPDLTGVGRSSLDALLANIIDPNQIIGKGYEHVEVETKDGRVTGGRLVEETDSRVKLLMAGPSEEVIAKSDIERMQVSEFSVMPEGLEQIPDDDFRNMVWYILNPPEDNRPMTPELRRELIGGEL